MIEKQIYLAGKMSGISYEESNDWRTLITEMFKEIDTNYKIKCINPNDYYNFLDDSIYDSQQEIMDYDLHRVKHSDLVVVDLRYDSFGTAMEIFYAHRILGIPVIGIYFDGINEFTHPWVERCVNKKLSNLLEAVDYVEHYYLS